MSLLDTLKAKLDPELFAQVTDALGDDFDYDLVTRARLNAVIGQREAAKRAAQRQQHLQGSTGPEGEPGPDGDPMAMFMSMMQSYLQSQGVQQGQSLEAPKSAADVLPGQQRLIDETQIQARVDAEVQKQVNQVKQQYAITEKLREAGAVDPSLILNGGLLDQSQLKWSESDPTKLESGFDEQLTALKENRAYLFQQSQPQGSAFGTGRMGTPGSFGGVSSLQDFSKLPMDQQMAFKTQHPEAFKGFMAQAGFAGLIGGPDQ